MNDLILSIRQMMADKKFSNAFEFFNSKVFQKEIDLRGDVGILYLELAELNHVIPNPDVFKKILESFFPEHVELVHPWMNKFLNILSPFERTMLEIRVTDATGAMDELYALISSFYLRQYEHHAPSFPVLIESLHQKYFKEDFSLNLRRLALLLRLGNAAESDVLSRDILLSCFEKTTMKNRKLKINALFVLLESEVLTPEIGFTRDLCRLLDQGIREKKDFKRAAELVIFHDRFEILVLLLHLLDAEQLDEARDLLVPVVKQHSDYDFVYLDKHFPHLKKFFFTAKKTKTPGQSLPNIDLRVESPLRQLDSTEGFIELDEESLELQNLLKYQDFSAEALTEIAVSFIQSGFPKAALRASEMALSRATEDVDKLKAYYLKLTCLLELKDFRLAIDVSFEALEISKTQEDVLSFLYCQAEAFSRLGLRAESRSVYQKVFEINPDYRLTRERLEKNAI